jgi:hypothetical protein
LARRLGLSTVCWSRCLVDPAGALALRSLPVRDVGHRGTIFQDTHLPLTLWFRAMWQITSQKNGISALGLQRVLGLGSYKTAWAMLHKLRRAMVRPGRDPLAGVVEVDEAYWGGEETGATGRQTEMKTRIIVAAEEDGNGIGRIRLRTIPDVSKASLHGFIRQAIAPGSTVRTDGWPAYRGPDGYVHDRQVQSHQPEEEHLLPRASRDLAAEAMAAGNAPRRCESRASGRLPGRVHVPIQPPHLEISRQIVLSTDATGRADRSRSIRHPGQTTTGCTWWRQVNIPMFQK